MIQKRTFAAIDSKLRACDLVTLRVRDVAHGERIAQRAIVLQQKTQRPVQFEITEQTRNALGAWITRASLPPQSYLFPSRLQILRTYLLGNTLESWINGLLTLDWTLLRTENIRCGVQRHR